MNKILTGIILMFMVSTVNAYTVHYCDVCDDRVTDNDNRFLQTPKITYSTICEECYHYLDVNIDELIQDIRKAQALTYPYREEK